MEMRYQITIFVFTITFIIALLHRYSLLFPMIYLLLLSALHREYRSFVEGKPSLVTLEQWWWNNRTFSIDKATVYRWTMIEFKLFFMGHVPNGEGPLNDVIVIGDKRGWYGIRIAKNQKWICGKILARIQSVLLNHVWSGSFDFKGQHLRNVAMRRARKTKEVNSQYYTNTAIEIRDWYFTMEHPALMCERLICFSYDALTIAENLLLQTKFAQATRLIEKVSHLLYIQGNVLTSGNILRQFAYMLTTQPQQRSICIVIFRKAIRMFNLTGNDYSLAIQCHRLICRVYLASRQYTLARDEFYHISYMYLKIPNAANTTLDNRMMLAAKAFYESLMCRIAIFDLYNLYFQVEDYHKHNERWKHTKYYNEFFHPFLKTLLGNSPDQVIRVCERFRREHYLEPWLEETIQAFCKKL